MTGTIPPMTHPFSPLTPAQRWFEDFQIGERFPLPSRTMTEAIFLAFQAASGNNHPIHYDVEYCRHHGHPYLLAHGYQVAIQTEAELGPITILVNNAGIAWAATIDTWEPTGFARLRAVNVDGTIHTIRAVAPGMRDRKYGRIINISSVASFGTTGFAGNHFYASTKTEVNILTRRFALELGEHGITVNAVAPGLIRSDMTQGNKSDAEWTEMRDTFARVAMMGRVGEPEEIARAITFLAAPDAGFITAQVLAVDGGRKDYIGHG